MNLFYLDEDLDLCAQYHIDVHVGKIQLEAAQLLAGALWVDQLFGFVPEKLSKEQLAILRLKMSELPALVADRKDIRYKAAHINHPSAIWVRSSLENYIWTLSYIVALNDENVWRGNKSHASCAEALRMPEPKLLTDTGFTKFAQAMPDELKRDNPVEAYRLYYQRDKASIASWKRRGPPEWWNPECIQ